MKMLLKLTTKNNLKINLEIGGDSLFFKKHQDSRPWNQSFMGMQPTQGLGLGGIFKNP